ncbi:aminotransferase, classes I and II [Scenedesmus sp. NREL 46B-D3]|nr:aminotransferase, classes I and II [Scenedesmus sp. NREL 46B-D3]
MAVQIPRPFKLERFFAKYEFQSPYLLCCSDCEALTMQELLAAADEDTLSRWSSLKLSYTESQGLPALREAIAALYERLQPEQLVVCVPEEGVYLTMRVLLQPGDKRLIQPGTKLVVVNFPHNPTGATLSPDDWQALIARCRQVGAWLFSDEMYRYTELPPSGPLPSAVDCYERAVSLCGLSKSWGLPGLRLGWIACQDQQLLHNVLALKDYTTICSPGPSEVLALAAVRATRQLTQRCRDIIAANLVAADAFFARWTDIFEWHQPQGGPVAFPRLRTGEDVEQWCQRVVTECGVLLLPASVYDHEASVRRGHFRLGLGRQNMPQCLQQLDAWLLKKYRS